jgi:hypothetical protein
MYVLPTVPQKTVELSTNVLGGHLPVRFHKAPPTIELNVYYQGGRTTPLIDAFFVQKEEGGDQPILYLVQLSISKKKESKAPAGQALVRDIHQTTLVSFPFLRLT